MLFRMSEAQSGDYSCTASLENGRRSFVQTTVRLKPDIILSQSQRIVAEENDDVFLECLLVPGVQAKPIWQYNGEYIYGERTSYENQGELFELKNWLNFPIHFFDYRWTFENTPGFAIRFRKLHLFGSSERYVRTGYNPIRIAGTT